MCVDYHFIVLLLVASASAIDCLERLVAEMSVLHGQPYNVAFFETYVCVGLTTGLMQLSVDTTTITTVDQRSVPST